MSVLVYLAALVVLVAVIGGIVELVHSARDARHERLMWLDLAARAQRGEFDEEASR